MTAAAPDRIGNAGVLRNGDGGQQLVTLADVLFPGNHPEIPRNMQSANSLASQRNYVVNMVGNPRLAIAHGRLTVNRSYRFVVNPRRSSLQFSGTTLCRNHTTHSSPMIKDLLQASDLLGVHTHGTTAFALGSQAFDCCISFLGDRSEPSLRGISNTLPAPVLAILVNILPRTPVSELSPRKELLTLAASRKDTIRQSVPLEVSAPLTHSSNYTDGPQGGEGPLGQAEVAARTEKQAAILTLLASDPLVSYAEIARLVGVSRERVRQIALKVGETGNQRRKRRPKKQPVYKYKWPGLKDGGKWLTAKVNQWLGPAEFYCAWCHRPRPIERKAAGSAYCKECACLRLCAYLKTPAGKAYKARYEKTEQRCAYLRRWRKRRTGARA